MEKLKKNRAASFIAVTIIYILAAALGIVIYNSLTLNWYISLLIADVAATVFTFIFSIIFRNASVYDPYWSVQPPVILAAFAIGNGITALGAILLIAVFFWGIRLTANWAYTFKNLMHQDWRYTMLKEKTGVFYPIINFIGIHMVPTLVVYGCILPAAYAVKEGISVTAAGTAFTCLAIISAALQGIADIQMHRFRKSGRGGFIRDGLWKYSRHPNYLGEICMWWSIALAVVFSTNGVWYLSAGALANTVLFLAVSIPMAEKRQSGKAGYALYKSETRMLFPIKKKGKNQPKDRKKKAIIAASSVLVALALIVGACAIYLSSYYRADIDAIEAFEPVQNVSRRTLDDGTIVFEPESEPKAGLIFYPGGKVEYTAYIPLMAACAEKGILCALVKMPFNLAVFRINAADGIKEQFDNIDKWYIGGHSLGGSMAASYLKKHAKEYDGLILLASYSTADLSSTPLKVLSVYGSEDGVLNREKYESNKSNLPKDFYETVINGGNHAGFGMYGEQKKDGKASISQEEQIYATAAIISDFIK